MNFADNAATSDACMRFLLVRRLARAARGVTLGAACFSSMILVLVPVGSAKANELPAAMRFEQGMKAFARGAFEEAASSWSGAASAYEREGNTSARITALVHLAQAQSALCTYRQEDGRDGAARGGRAH